MFLPAKKLAKYLDPKKIGRTAANYFRLFAHLY